MLVTASSKFGLTKGGYNAPEISLTPLAVSILNPKSEEERENGLKKALFNIDIYKEIFNKYNNNKVPKKQLFKNTLLDDFDIPQDDTEQCYNLIMENAKELNILHEISGSLYFNLGKFGDTESVRKEISESITEIIEDTIEDRVKQTEMEQIKGKMITPEVRIKEELKPTVFISHSKNTKILKQIKQILEFGQFDYKIAIEEETAAIPIPEKIFRLMRECNCAIINISADEQEKLSDDTYKINENVLIEIGASFLRYDKKVILLVDKRIELPSNLQGLYRCDYEGNELTWDTGVKLQKVLQGFRK